MKLTNIFDVPWGRAIVPPDLDDSYLVVTSRNNFALELTAKAGSMDPAFFIHKLSIPRSADSLMQDMVDWIQDRKIFDQNDQHGDKYENYSLFMHVFRQGTFPACVDHIVLENYLFADCATVWNFDDFMRSLDRDALSSRIYQSLLEIDLSPEAGYDWQEAFRQCCHPNRTDWSRPPAATSGNHLLNCTF